MLDSLLHQIEQILQKYSHGLSEYELISELRKNPEKLFDDVDLQNAHALFQTHFLLFHCLYLLRDQWLNEKKAFLQIDTMKIYCLPYTQKCSDEITTEDSMRSYYLDISRLEQTTAEDADELINQFWQKFVAQKDRHEALKTLELEEDVGFEQIKARYKQLVMQHHPDRGGSASHLAAINQAMDVLKRYYQ